MGIVVYLTLIEIEGLFCFYESKKRMLHSEDIQFKNPQELMKKIGASWNTILFYGRKNRKIAT